MATLPRESKYRHIFSENFNADQCYHDIQPELYGESQHIALNNKYWAIPTQSSGGGSFIVHPLKETGRVKTKHPAVNYHTSHILELAFNPFHEDIIASSSDDCTVKILKIPENMEENIHKETIPLNGHSKRVTLLDWHPTTDNVLASSGNDRSVIIWDCEVGEMAINCNDHDDIVHSIAWNGNGKYIASSCQDKKIRIMDPRDESNNVLIANGHENRKISRVFWLNNRNMLGSIGFTKESFRQLLFFDMRKMETPYNTQRFDRQNSKFFPYFEEGNDILFLAGKGDLGIRAYEISEQEGFCHEITELKSPQPQKGIAVMPRKHLDTGKAEILRVFRLLAKSVEPLSVCVPRRNAMMVFQSDLYPDCYGGKSSNSIDEYFEGVDKDPTMESMNKRNTATSGRSNRFMRRNRNSSELKNEKTAAKPDEAREKVPTKEKEVKSSRGERNKDRRNKAEARKSVKKEGKPLAEASGKVKELELKLRRSEEAAAKLQEKLENSQLKLKEWVGKHGELEKRNKDLHSNNKNLNDKNKELEMKCLKLQEDKGDDSDSTIEQIASLKKKAKKYARKVRVLEREVEDSESIINKQADTIKSLNKKISSMVD